MEAVSICNSRGNPVSESQSISAVSSSPLAPRALGQALHRGFAAAVLLAASPLVFASTVLLPQFAGSYGTGDGANGRFVKIDDAWNNSSVLWTEPVSPGAAGTFGVGTPLSNFGWATGLWGRPDWAITQQSFLGNGGSAAPQILSSWSGLVSSINFGDATYNSNYDSAWGRAADLPNPLALGNENNWTSYFTGFIRITDPGAYNFSVLNDDGFFFRLVGFGGQSLEIGRDFLNPRDRNGFGEDLALTEGLYGFELGSWERIEAGVVDLRWTTPGSTNWVLVPTEHLVSAVPEAPTVTLAALGLLLIAAATRRRARAV